MQGNKKNKEQKIYAISDWHLSINNPKPMDIFGGAWENYVDELSFNLNKVLDADTVLLISGDISWAMKLEDAKPDLDFISKFKGIKILIRGNHDYWWSSISGVRSLLCNNTFALQNDSVKIGGTVFAGSRGWQNQADFTKEQNEKIYNRELLRIKLSLDDAIKKRQPGDNLVVMLHFPPFTNTNKTPLTELINSYNPSAVVYGHIHGKNYSKGLAVHIEGVPYYLTSCDILANIPLLIKPAT